MLKVHGRCTGPLDTETLKHQPEHVRLSNPTATILGKREPEGAGRAEYSSLACLHVGRGRGHPPPPRHHRNRKAVTKSSSLAPEQSVEG